ncbi:MAG: Mannose-1-phosphate guanylyltransferase RfbM [Chloroflexi bacterium ADurb.Bin180]|nr:MAG: Mannose-1-phosphate guanylyltransferase RfbM [Chloroflexi bacterium ADurb.Bin180]HNR96685.1 sugar phosphate nucleotidyltransferase [Anaerolineae bacterium]HNT04995.1 sugar phosphate nucleotidyltransferase [Anaerolineae bacterium]
MTTKPALYVVILAGGGGTRLWPFSRKRLPKHLLPVCGPRTLLAETHRRIQPLVADDHVMVITVAEHAETARCQLGAVPEDNIVVEPLGRGTGPAVGLMAKIIHQREPDAVMISLHADHAIDDEEGFRSVLLAAAQAAQDGHLVTLGITPTSPETGYGYIQRGVRLRQADGHELYRVLRFTEKPAAELARSFVESGDYFWNSGIFIWQVKALLEEFRRQRPVFYAQLQSLEPFLNSPDQDAAIARLWPQVESTSIDVGIMEGARNVAMIPASIGWNDVGCWTSVAERSHPDAAGNVLQGAPVAIDCKDTFVHSSGLLVAALGVEGLVIVATEDAVLVCPKERAQDVRQIVEALKKQGREEYL